MFEKLPIKSIYITKKDNFDEDFIIPVLQESIKYDRGVGYFSLGVLVSLSKGLIPFLRRGANIRIVTSVELKLPELQLIDNAHSIAMEKIKEVINDEIDKEINGDDELLSLDLITNLIASGRITIKIGHMVSGGIYHEKIGYFEDADGKKMWYIGSSNATFNGHNQNRESVSVIKSWESEGNYESIVDESNYFEDLWNDKDPEVRVMDFPDAAKQKLFSKYKKSNTVDEAITKIENKYSSGSGKTKKPFEYQEDAIAKFFSNECCGFYEMATGTGKTFTAVTTLKRMISSGKCERLYVMVLVPQIDLQEQWRKELKENGIDPFLFGGVSAQKDIDDEFNRSVIEYLMNEGLVVSVCVYDTFFAKISDKFLRENLRKMLVVDEAHELSANQIDALSESYEYRLGLSATPERHNQDETDSIISYFTNGTNDTFKYTIDEAIENKFLSHYEYYPIIARLSDDEFSEYKSINRQLRIQYEAEEKDKEKIQDLLIKRSRIIKKASNKIDVLAEMLDDPKYSFRNSVVYCGQGKDENTDERIIDIVTKLLSEKGGYSVSQFTSNTTDRIGVLEEFENGFYDVLVAIKCFDQGVDCPKLDKIFILASDALNRQTIQRRGRVLRICKESGKSMAYIYDMLTLPPEGTDDVPAAISLVKNELRRVNEYMRLADNKDDVQADLDKIIEEYDIMGDLDNGEEQY